MLTDGSLGSNFHISDNNEHGVIIGFFCDLIVGALTEEEDKHKKRADTWGS